MLFMPQDCQPWPSTPQALPEHGSHCSVGFLGATHPLGCAVPAQGAMADGCFLCSCLIFRASIARRYRSAGGK